jgi:hypothetical protein
VARPGDAYIGGALMMACLAFHIWAMFPAYPGFPPTPVESLPHDVAMFVCLEIGWGLAAILVLGRTSVAGGAALGLGLGAVELGLLLTDLVSGYEVHHLSEPGGWLALSGLGLGLAGALFAASSVVMGLPRRGANPAYAARALATLPIAVLAVITFWLSWQTGRVVYTNGLAAPINGDVFYQSVGPLAASLIAGLAIGLVAIAAAWWARPGVGAWALVGVAFAMSSQLLAAYVQVREPLADAVNDGVSNGLDLARSSLSLTADWGADVVAVVALLALAIWAGLDARRTEDGTPEVSGLGPTGDEAAEQWPAGHRWPR